MDQKTTSAPIWQVQADPEAAARALDTLAAMLSSYYNEIMRRTNNNDLAIALTVDYQRLLLGMAKQQ